MEYTTCESPRIHVQCKWVCQIVQVEPYAVANEQTRCVRGRSNIVDGKKTVMSNRTVSNNRDSIVVQSLKTIAVNKRQITCEHRQSKLPWLINIKWYRQCMISNCHILAEHSNYSSPFSQVQLQGLMSFLYIYVLCLWFFQYIWGLCLDTSQRSTTQVMAQKEAYTFPQSLTWYWKQQS